MTYYRTGIRNLTLLFVLPLFVLPSLGQDYTFTDVTAAAGVVNDDRFHFGGTWSDYDKDGCLDLYVVNGEGMVGDETDINTLYRGHCDGTFTDVTEETGAGDPWVAMRNVWADYDQDGDLDFYSHNFVQSTLYQNRQVEDGVATFVDVNASAGTDVQMSNGTSTLR